MKLRSWGKDGWLRPEWCQNCWNCVPDLRPRGEKCQINGLLQEKEPDLIEKAETWTWSRPRDYCSGQITRAVWSVRCRVGDMDGGAGWDWGDGYYGYSRDVALKPANMEGWDGMEYGNKKTRSSLIFRISIGSSIVNEEAQMKSSWDVMQTTRMDHPEEGLELPQHQLLWTQDHLWLFTLNINLNFTTFLNYRNKCMMPQSYFSFVPCLLSFDLGKSNLQQIWYHIF